MMLSQIGFSSRGEKSANPLCTGMLEMFSEIRTWNHEYVIPSTNPSRANHVGDSPHWVGDVRPIDGCYDLQNYKNGDFIT